MTGVAFVTGASRGIGRAIAFRLAKDGYTVAVNDIPAQQQELEEVHAELLKSGKASSIFLGDVSVESQVESMINAVVNQLGSLDVMVANAGVSVTKPFLETTAEDVHKMFSVNVYGTFFCFKYAALQMIKQGKGGKIIGASSVAGKQGHSFIGAYSSSKFAVRGMTQAAALELAKYKINVNAYAPGAVDTAMLEETRQYVSAKRGIEVPRNANPIGRDATPDDIAGLVSYLVSEDASMITGQSISINGGTFFD